MIDGSEGKQGVQLLEKEFDKIKQIFARQSARVLEKLAKLFPKLFGNIKQKAYDTYMGESVNGAFLAIKKDGENDNIACLGEFDSVETEKIVRLAKENGVELALVKKDKEGSMAQLSKKDMERITELSDEISKCQSEIAKHQQKLRKSKSRKAISELNYWKARLESLRDEYKNFLTDGDGNTYFIYANARHIQENGWWTKNKNAFKDKDTKDLIEKMQSGYFENNNITEKEYSLYTKTYEGSTDRNSLENAMEYGVGNFGPSDIINFIDETKENTKKGYFTVDVGIREGARILSSAHESSMLNGKRKPIAGFIKGDFNYDDHINQKEEDILKNTPNKSVTIACTHEEIWDVLSCMEKPEDAVVVYHDLNRAHDKKDIENMNTLEMDMDMDKVEDFIKMVQKTAKQEKIVYEMGVTKTDFAERKAKVTILTNIQPEEFEKKVVSYGIEKIKKQELDKDRALNEHIENLRKISQKKIYIKHQRSGELAINDDITKGPDKSRNLLSHLNSDHVHFTQAFTECNRLLKDGYSTQQVQNYIQNTFGKNIFIDGPDSPNKKNPAEIIGDLMNHEDR